MAEIRRFWWGESTSGQGGETWDLRLDTGFGTRSRATSQFMCQENPSKNPANSEESRRIPHSLRSRSRKNLRTARPPAPQSQRGPSGPRKRASEVHSGQFARPRCGERRPVLQRFSSDFPCWSQGLFRGPDVHNAQERPSNSSANLLRRPRGFVGPKIAPAQRADHA